MQVCKMLRIRYVGNFSIKIFKITFKYWVHVYFLSIRMETLPSTFLKSVTNVPTLPTQNFPTSQHFWTNGTAKILSVKKGKAWYTGTVYSI